jgi:hypothetical protein
MLAEDRGRGRDKLPGCRVADRGQLDHPPAIYLEDSDG